MMEETDMFKIELFGKIIKDNGGKLYNVRDIPAPSRKENGIGMFEYKDQRYGVYRDKQSRKYKIRFNVEDYRHPQISTYGSLHKTIKECHSFAHKVINELSLTNSQHKFEVIKHVSMKIAERL